MQDIERIFADMKKEIAEESKEEVNAILADVKKSEDDALVTMQQEAKKNADLRLKQELEEMHSEAATEISQVNSERMKKLIEKRDEYVNTIFKTVEDQLHAFVESDEYGRVTAYSDVSLPDGTYEAKVVLEQTRPIEFLIESR